MKATGIVRRIDDIGRINIPKEIRMQIFGTQATVGEPMEIFLDGNDIVLRKYESKEKRKEKEIRAKAIDEFYNEVLNFEDYIEPSGTSEFGSVLLYSNKDITNMICKIAEQMKAGGMNE